MIKIKKIKIGNKTPVWFIHIPKLKITVIERTFLKAIRRVYILL